MPQLFTNNARALLTASITNTATSIVIESAKADLFPVANVGANTLPSANNWFKVTLQDSSGNVEIVAVRTRTAGSGILSNVIRGYDGTTAQAFTTGTVVGLRITADDVQSALDLPNQNNIFTGDNTFTSTVTAPDFDGDLTGNVTGNADTVTNGVYTTGNQTIGGTKTFSSPIAGSVTGSANSLSGVDWTVAEVSNKLVFRYGGVTKFSIDSSGNMIVTGNVTAYGTP